MHPPRPEQVHVVSFFSSTGFCEFRNMRMQNTLIIVKARRHVKPQRVLPAVPTRQIAVPSKQRSDRKRFRYCPAEAAPAVPAEQMTAAGVTPYFAAKYCKYPFPDLSR